MSRLSEQKRTPGHIQKSQSFSTPQVGFCGTIAVCVHNALDVLFRSVWEEARLNSSLTQRQIASTSQFPVNKANLTITLFN